MSKDDAQYFKNGDVFYLAMEGEILFIKLILVCHSIQIHIDFCLSNCLFLYLAEPFNFCAILDDYDIEKEIGRGGYGVVNLAINKETRKKFAVKFMDISSARKS